MNRGVIGVITALVVALATSLIAPSRSFAEVTHLSTDSRPSPTLGVDSARPEFSWTLELPEAYNARQTGYELHVSSDRAALEDGSSTSCWHSGFIASAKSFGAPYTGPALESSRRYYWRVDARWRGELASGELISGIARGYGEFVTGVLTPQEWQGQWITAERSDSDPLPLLFCRFELSHAPEEIVDAFLHSCGLGQQIVSVNDLRVDNSAGIDPGWTNYRKTCLYTTFDVTKELMEGAREASVSIALGNGMYNVPGGRYVKFTGSFGLPKAIAQLVIRYKDGAVQTIGTDEHWQTLPTGAVFSCVYGGDDLDFSHGVFSHDRLVATGVPVAAKACEGPGGALRAQGEPAVVGWQRVQPEETRVLEDGRIEANFGYNFAGRVILHVIPHEGDILQVDKAEMQGKPWAGHYDQYRFNRPLEADASNGTIRVETARISADKNYGAELSTEEELSPPFGYWGFQYAYIKGAGYEPDVTRAKELSASQSQITSIEAQRIGANLVSVGSFESDGAHLEAIDQMIDRSVRSNIVSLMTDCPHREKLGWLEETHLMGPSVMYRYDLHALFRKVCRDMTEAQLDDGMIPDIAPEYTRFQAGFFWSAEWSAACVQLPWYLYTWYGDESIISEQYPTMDRYVRYMSTIRDASGLVRAGLGDWYDWSEQKRHAGYSQHTPGELTATAFLCDNARKMAFFAQKLGKSDDARYYRNLYDEGRSAFIRAYWDAERSVVATGSQASYGFALAFDLVPEEGRAAAFENLLAEIEKWDYRMSCGEVAWPFVIRTLASFGRNDVLWKMIQRDNAPGYVHMLEHWGMKTLSETWDGPGSSMNHFMFGAIQEWFTSDIVGIQQTSDSVGFSELLLRPSPMPGKVERASGHFQTPYGDTSSAWSLKGASREFVWDVTVPFGAQALTSVPVKDEQTQVTIERVQGDATVTTQLTSQYESTSGDNPNRRLFRLGSGVYRITSAL
ncbi:MAG: alpha-L-rhamnosidase N-terminal domain-containing protein [Planctomycetia bacterium]|nr:alpha-L-rhamnosidase N-terminal domain-containing protein [Planctomycetia bacterium]